MRTTIVYYRIIVGWASNTGTVGGMLNDAKTLSAERKQELQLFLKCAIQSNIISDPDVARDVLARL